MHPKQLFVLASAIVVAAAVSAPSTLDAQACECENTDATICSQQGFEVTLLNFAVDQQAGTSFWDYEVCNDKGLDGDCLPPKDLSHIDIDLPALGDCLLPSQQISLVQIGGFGEAVLACGVSEKDPSCDIFGTPGSDFVAKCDVAGGDIDPSECVVMRLEIAGEQPSLGPGVSMTVTKAGTECVGDCILGPSCTRCEEPPTDECLTRTPGFWGTHPHITNLFLPVSACGAPLEAVEAGTCNSATEAMCVSPGRESRGNRAYAQLVRQLTAAQLNLAATDASGGQCDVGIEARIAECEALCGANQKTISGSGCIEDLAAFNESLDSFLLTPAPFDGPGPANPSECQQARGNGLVIGKGSC